MSAANPALTADGFTTLQSGMNDGKSQVRLLPSEAALLINATTRGDFAQRRPPFRKVMTAIAQPPGFYQHGSWYVTDNGQVFLMLVVAGRFYRVDPKAKTVLEVTIPGDPNPSTITQGFSVQGELWWLYNDGQSPLFIFNGSSSRRAAANELQPGTVLAYVQGRIWYALPNGLGFRASDLVGNQDSGSSAYQYRDSILHETENDFLNEGGDFRVPSDAGAIRAMRATSILDTSQGQGPLQVLCDTNGFSVNTPVDRTTWKSVQYPIQTESLIGAGASAAQSTINVNGDLFFRSPDGIRSFIIARRQFRDWGNTPQSFEISGILDYDQKDLLRAGSAVVFDNRMLMTLSPVWSQSGIYHRGLAVMDLSPINSILQDGTPCYDGIWTGLNILTIISTTVGVYAVTLAPNGSIEIWQLTDGLNFSNTDEPITWTVIPRSLFVETDPAGRPGRTLKKLQTADLEYDEIAGAVHFKLSWAPDSYPCYTTWAEWDECNVPCGTTPGCTPSLNLQAGYQPRKRVAEPPDVCAPGARRPLRNFYRLNVRLDISGQSRLLGFRAAATLEGEPKFEANTCEPPVCVPISCCNGTSENLNPFTYSTPGQATTPPYGSGGGSGGGGGGSGSPPFVPPPGPTVGGDQGSGNVNVDPQPDTPAVPPHDSVPQFPNLPPLAGGNLFYGLWTDPGPLDVNGNTHEVGRSTEPPDGLGPGVLEAWSQSLWQQFQAFVVANNLTVTAAQIETAYQPGNTRRYDPNDVFNSGFYTSSLGRNYVLRIDWLGH